MQQSAFRGYLLAFLGVIVISPDALLIRLADENPWVLSCWRGAIAGIMIIVFNRLIDQRSWRQQLAPAGKRSFLLVGINAVSQLGFVLGISFANVTEVLVIIAFAPLLSALFSAIFLGEKVLLRTWVATLICGVGLAVLFSQPSSGDHLFGQLAAVVTAVTLAAQFVVIRSAPDANLTVALGAGNILNATFCLFVAGTLTLQPGALLPILAMGLLVSPLPFLLFIISLRYITAAETSLILLLETILGSWWVWVVLAEKPNAQTFIAAVLILSTLTGYGLLVLRDTGKAATPQQG